MGGADVGKSGEGFVNGTMEALLRCDVEVTRCEAAPGWGMDGEGREFPIELGRVKGADDVGLPRGCYSPV